jgi:hypothetical protein
VISEAGLKRLQKAAEGAGDMERTTVLVADVFSAVATIRALKVQAERDDTLRRALRTIGDALHDMPEFS